jgi:uncharacterized membrane protein
VANAIAVNPAVLRRDLRGSESGAMRRRRAIIAVSVAGMSAMTAVALFQTGILKRLPELPLKGFHAGRVTLSSTAFALGVPDGSLSVASFAANIPLAAAGDAARDRTQPWIPVAACAKAGIESLVSAWYLTREKSRCSYCLAAAAANFTIFALTLPEARRAIRNLAPAQF